MHKGRNFMCHSNSFLHVRAQYRLLVQSVQQVTLGGAKP